MVQDYQRLELKFSCLEHRVKQCVFTPAFCLYETQNKEINFFESGLDERRKWEKPFLKDQAWWHLTFRNLILLLTFTLNYKSSWKSSWLRNRRRNFNSSIQVWKQWQNGEITRPQDYVCDLSVTRDKVINFRLSGICHIQFFQLELDTNLVHPKKSMKKWNCWRPQLAHLSLKIV